MKNQIAKILGGGPSDELHTNSKPVSGGVSSAQDRIGLMGFCGMVINHTNFQAPSGAPSVTEVGTEATFATSSGFGKIIRTQPNRQMQVSARFFF